MNPKKELLWGLWVGLGMRYCSSGFVVDRILPGVTGFRGSVSVLRFFWRGSVSVGLATFRSQGRSLEGFED